MDVQSVNYKSDSEPNAWPKRPFLTILYKPRSTIRAIVDSTPKKHLLLLASLSGIAQMLSLTSQNYSRSLDSASLIEIIIFIILIGGVIFGIATCYIGSFFLRRVSNLLGGVATSESVRAAFVWSSIPTISLLVIWMLKFALYGKNVFNTNSPAVALNPLPYFLFSLVEFIFGIWALFLFWKCLGEVNRFSVWKAIIVQVISTAIVIFILVVIVRLASLA